MITKFNNFNDVNAIVSEAINFCFKEGYTIDTKESVIDQEKEKDCTFKTVMKRYLDGIECKTIIKLTNNIDDKNKYCKYHKVEFVGDTKWSEETCTFSCSTDKSKFNNKVDNTCKQNTKQWNLEDDYLRGNYKDTVDTIFKCFGLHRVDNDEVDDSKNKFNDVDKVISDNKTCNCNKQNTCNKCSKTELNDSVDNNYNNVDCRKNIKDTYNSKDEYVNKESNVTKQDQDDDVEDSLIKLVHYIFGM